MDECNSIECNEVSNLNAISLSVTPLDNQQFRLNKINKIKNYFIIEITERELMSKKLNKYIPF